MVAALLELVAMGTLGQAPAPLQVRWLAAPTQVQVVRAKPIPWWDNAEKERIRFLFTPFTFDVRDFPGRPDLGNPQAPQFPKPLW